MVTPIVAEFAEEEIPQDLCEEINCDDLKPCTKDSCNPATGECTYTNLTDGTSCGTNKECKQGECLAKSVSVDGEKEKPKETDFTPFIVLIIIIIIAGIAYYYFKIKKSKNNLTYKK